MEREGRGELHVRGRVKTAIALRCRRCFAPVAQRISVDFNLTLTPYPIVEPTQKNLGVILAHHDNAQFTDTGADALSPQTWETISFTDTSSLLLDNVPVDDNYEEGEVVLDLDMDDRLHFPPSEKVMDLSKYFRDVIHLEVPMGVVCKDTCKGLCLKCGNSLTMGLCRCAEKEKKGGSVGKQKGKAKDRRWGVLEQLREQLDEAGGA
eukprot:TRINITY_DN30298_c0_g1_i1.p1 TRINITY_DN30298_c0_g1~~TRINITY_DN30298_c0_g1_i1.p1  ORF type:complete len:222 (-),score=33.58 TRINITY_DN30298_c0_g1_i1:124-744(-)